MRWSAWAGVGFAALLMTAVVSAADVTGKWKAEYTTPDGQQRESTFTFKVSGETLTGTVASAMGEVPIEQGKAAGDSVTFSVTRNFQGNDVKIRYDGKVSGNEIKFAVTFGDMGTFDIVAKKLTS